MRISYNWLKEYVDVRLPPEKLAGAFTMAGLSVESLTRAGDDWIFELEATSNRPDWLSYIGVARELSAITGRKLRIPTAKVHQFAGLPVSRLKNENRPTGQPANRITVKVEDRKLCPRYTARIIRGVKVGESPAWLKGRMEAMGLRSVNNVVDITNFCLFETGEPMHAFDLDRIAGGEVMVRRAKKEEKILTIDGSEKPLDDSVLVIADRDKPIAVAGVMGGFQTEVSLSTKNILLEAASFDSVSVRRAGRALGLATESSYRFERKVDIGNIVYSSDRATGLIAEIAGGTVGEMFDIGVKKEPRQDITLRFARLDKITGADIDKKKAEKILRSLGLEIKKSSGDALKLGVPGFRNDLREEIDVIEEVIRVYGYDKIPPTMPAVTAQPLRRPPATVLEDEIRRTLVGLGMDEIVTYSLISKKVLEMAGLAAEAAISIKNPLSAEQEVMRPDLFIGILNAMLWNMNRKNKDLELFEIGKIYIKGEDTLPKEERALSLGLAGQVNPDRLSEAREYDFSDLKGIVETVLEEVGISGYSVEHASHGLLSPASSAAIRINGRMIGIMGEVRRDILANFDIKDKLYASQIALDALMKYAVLEKKFTQLPKYPSVQRDISVIADKRIPNADMVKAIKEAAGGMLKSVKLIDRYTGRQIPNGKASLTYRLEYQDASKTLEEKDIASPHGRVLRSLEEKFGAKLR
jgi:phenylalanyl-tRNA synthetase beta chain